MEALARFPRVHTSPVWAKGTGHDFLFQPCWLLARLVTPALGLDSSQAR